MTATTSALRSEASLVMTRATISLFDDSALDKTTLLNLELKRQERRRNLRYRNSVLLDESSSLLQQKSKTTTNTSTATLERKTKTPDEYAKDLEQWLKKMKCTGVTGIRLESFNDIKVGVLEEKVDTSAPSVEPFPKLWQQKFKYKGYKDEHGRPKGKATIEFENGDNIHGSFLEGLRHGECRIELVNENEMGISYIIGNYVKDELQGKCRVGYANDSGFTEGYTKHGIFHGFVRKFDEKGRLIFIGTYKNGHPYGVCWRTIRGGGVVVGRVNSKGQLSGMRIAYLYPDFKTALVGTFVDGVLEEAKATTLKTVVDDRGIKIPIFNEAVGPTYCREISNYTFVTNYPMLPDPYENKIVKVCQSRIDGAHEGLFAKKKIEPNTILTFYQGVRLDPKTARDMPNWEDNAYRIFDPSVKEGTIDIPKEFLSTANYCASLAHKTNHSFCPNAEFVAFEHPRFGLVPSILSTHDIEEDEEIFVHYGYELQDSPDWYEQAWLAGDFPVPPKFKEWLIPERDKNGISLKPELKGSVLCKDY